MLDCMKKLFTRDNYVPRGEVLSPEEIAKNVDNRRVRLDHVHYEISFDNTMKPQPIYFELRFSIYYKTYTGKVSWGDDETSSQLTRYGREFLSYKEYKEWLQKNEDDLFNLIILSRWGEIRNSSLFHEIGLELNPMWRSRYKLRLEYIKTPFDEYFKKLQEQIKNP